MLNKRRESTLAHLLMYFVLLGRRAKNDRCEGVRGEGVHGEGEMEAGKIRRKPGEGGRREGSTEGCGQGSMGLLVARFRVNLFPAVRH